MADVEIKQRDRILEAIDQLRRRKARPDSPRICNYMMRRFNVDAKETKSDLQKCVENEIVFKVEYKGDISYRNAAKWNQKHRSGEIIDPAAAEKKVSGSFSKIVALSVSELICQEPDFLELGVPGQALIKTIIAKSLIKYNKKHLILLLQREVENGGLVKLENGHYSLGSNAIDTDKSDDEYGTEENDIVSLPQIFSLESSNDKVYRKNKPTLKSKKDEENDKVTNGQLGFRVGSRRKLAKKVFDPSDNNLPKRKRGRPVGSLNKSSMIGKKSPSRPASVASNTNKIESHSNVITCSICHQIKKPYEPIISCRDCGVKNHLACFQNNPERIENELNNVYTYPRSDWSTWYCSQCKSCVTCFELADSKPYVTCSICYHAYHYDCHNPKLDIKSNLYNENWICYTCHNVPIKTENNANDISVNNENSRSSLHHSDSSNISTSPPALSPQNRTPNDNQSNCSSDYKIDNVSNDDNDIDENMMEVDEENNDSNKSYEAIDDPSYDPSIPDATSWTHEDVYEYFSQYFPQEAAVFRDQEIDGHSLLLMKRSDVLSSLNLKLGPALKIYRHVLRLQIRRDYVKLGWF